jgi:hypothetical protein
MSNNVPSDLFVAGPERNGSVDLQEEEEHITVACDCNQPASLLCVTVTTAATLKMMRLLQGSKK